MRGRRTPAAPHPRAEEHRLAGAVRDLYGSGWAVYQSIRNTTGIPHDVLRYANVIAVDLRTWREGWRLHGCLQEWPTDLEMVEAAIAEATPQLRERLAALLAVPALGRAIGGAA
jgi:hypothetical protein